MSNDPRLLQWRNLPMELRLKKHWLVAHPVNKNPLFYRDFQFYNASVSKHLDSQWMTFEEATLLALTHNLAIGFVLKEGEEYTCIDLDVKPNTTKEALDLFQLIVQKFDTYTERSIGGHGIHIWCKGSIGLGRRRDGVEVYSQNRFMICTGNVLHRKEQLEYRQTMLTNMLSQMSLSNDYSEIVLEEVPQIDTDENIGKKLWENEDAKMLWQGMWQELDHPSQSEGDLDLMVHLVRLSPSNEQCRRLFRQSGLGKRTKANRTDYVLRTLRHARYIRQCELVDIEAGRRTAEAIAAKYDAEQMRATGTESIAYSYSTETFEQTFVPEGVPLIADPDIEGYQLEFPPGGMGYLAHCFYKGSVYPNVEFSVAAAITVVSAICGRAWNTSTRSGLNTYNLVVAPSGMGKDEMQKGIFRLIENCQVKFPMFGNFFHFGQFASGQGLMKHFNPARASFAQVMAEFGGLVRRFSNGRDENMQGLMSVMLDLHSKAGPDSISNSIIYSDAAKNVISVKSPAYSLLGDTTPEVFESVNSFLLNNGFISRFNIFEYKGDRAPMNENVDHNIDPKFIDYLIMIARVSDQLTTQKRAIVNASLSPEAQQQYFKFRKFCDDNYNRAVKYKGQDVEHHMWSRSLNRINVLATLAAILDSPPVKNDGTVTPPVVTGDHWNYFERMIVNDINNFKTKQDSGDLGSGNAAQIRKLEALFDEYISSKQLSNSYRVDDDLRASGKITYRFIRARMTQVSAFRTEGSFEDKKLKDALQTLMKMGRLREIKDPASKGSRSGDLYWIVSVQ